MHPLREYQQQAIARLRAALAGKRKVILQLPTGGGKTRIAAEIVGMARAKGRKVLFLAPRRELIDQAIAAFSRHGIRAGVIMAGRERDSALDIQVASFDTLHARGIRKASMRMPDADLVIVDECHLSIAQSRREILDRYAASVVVGLTATPARGDGKGMGEVYEAIAFGPSVAELTAQGFLVPVRYFAPSKPDLASLRVGKEGDYIEAGLAAAMDKPQLVGDIVDNWQRLAPTRRTVVFCVNCAHSRHVRDEFLARGISAAHVDGETPMHERAEILAGVESGKYQVLTNVFVASYGLDIPALDCAVLARPTKNITLYLQTCGRVLRPFPGKADAFIIDHSGAIEENGYVDDDVPWSLDGKESVKDRKERLAKERKDHAQITCPLCTCMFKGRHDCPNCRYGVIPAGKAIPVVQADLYEVQRELKKANRTDTWESKEAFLGMLRTHAVRTAKKPGWAAYKYREKYGVWPNDERVKHASMREPTPEVMSWITSRNIAYAKRKPA